MNNLEQQKNVLKYLSRVQHDFFRCVTNDVIVICRCHGSRGQYIVQQTIASMIYIGNVHS